jgi:hypothetical protein
VVNWEGCGGNTYYQQRYMNLYDTLAGPNIEISFTIGKDHLYMKPIDSGNNISHYLHRQPSTPSLNNPIF